MLYNMLKLSYTRLLYNTKTARKLSFQFADLARRHFQFSDVSDIPVTSYALKMKD